MVPIVDLNAGRKEKLVVIMGATGTGKSRLSVDLATRFPGEIVNSDKMQVYKGLDITTNKIPDHERCGVPHHLIDCIEAENDISVNEYVHLAAGMISDISSRGQVPILVGGSNSYIQALVCSNDVDPSVGFRYDCCFIWVDVALDVLAESVCRRVDDMIDAGLLTEMVDFYDPKEGTERGIRKSIGVPEFARYFLHYPPGSGTEMSDIKQLLQMDEKRKKMFDEAVEEMKMNTIKLTEKQAARIRNFRDCGWDIHRIEATPVFTAAASEALHVWESNVLNPALEIVKKFLSPIPVKIKMVKEEQQGEAIDKKEQPMA